MLGNEVMNKEQLYDLFQQILGVKKFEHQLLYNAMQVSQSKRIDIVCMFKILVKDINKRSGRSVLYHRTGLSTIRTLIKTGSKILRTGTVAEFKPFVDFLYLTRGHGKLCLSQ